MRRAEAGGEKSARNPSRPRLRASPRGGKDGEGGGKGAAATRPRRGPALYAGARLIRRRTPSGCPAGVRAAARPRTPRRRRLVLKHWAVRGVSPPTTLALGSRRIGDGVTKPDPI